MPDFLEIIWSLNGVLISWLLMQYFKLRKEIDLINLSLVKNYATNEAIEKLVKNQSEMLTIMTDIKIAQATLFERIDRYHVEASRN